jgi:hypothetical protein
MPSKGKKSTGEPTPLGEMIAEATAVGGGGATASVPGGASAAEAVPSPVLVPEATEPKPFPTHLEQSGGLPEDPSPDDVLSALNHLAATGSASKEQFDDIYLHHFGPLGATQEDADLQWDALHQKLQVDRAAAQELAAKMVAEATEPPGVRPWNPLEDPAAATAQVEQVRQFFNSMVQAARDERNQAGSQHHTAGFLKDKIVSNLAQRAGLGYGETDELIHAWAGTSSDSVARSVAMQMAAAEKFGMEPTPYLAKQDAQFSHSGDASAYAKYKEQTRELVGAMYSTTQDWLAEHGIKELVVWRGMHSSIGTAKEVLDSIKASDQPLEVAAHLNPMNSWSANYDKARSFAGPSGFILSARVPASKVIGSCFTGTGCLNEQEFVVLGGEGVPVAAAYVGNVAYHHASGGNWEGS